MEKGYGDQMVIKQRVKRIYKSLPPHSNEAFPLTNTGEANKALIIGIIAIVAVIALSLLLFFTDTFVGKGIEYQLTSVCGNSKVELGEKCDDANKVNSDGCSSACLIESGYTCTLPTTKIEVDRNGNPVTTLIPSKCTSKYYIAVTDNVKDIAPTYLISCGNGVIDTGETCDDGGKCNVKGGQSCLTNNNLCGSDKSGPIACKLYSNDGCSSTCQEEEGWECKSTITIKDVYGSPTTKNLIPNQCTKLCGNGIKAGTEQCDNGLNNGDGKACTLECKNNICGDGKKYLNVEQCDNGANNGDAKACTSICTNNICGDGKQYLGVEQCDDGDNDNGDGCSASCQTEAPPAPAQLGACPVFGDYNGDGKTNSADTVKFNWHVLFGDNLGSAGYVDDTCGGLNENSCLITGTTKYICDDGTGLASTMATCPGGCLLGDYNSDGKTNSADTVKFNWHVLFGDNLGSASYGDDNCGATGEAPCSIGSNGKFICDDGSGLADNANVMCS